MDSRAPMHPALTFVGDWLVLGAGTRLAFAKRGAHRPALDKIEGGEARINALLCAAYGRPLEPSALRHIQRAIVKQSEGDATLASMHLAMTGLWPLRQPKEAAYRLFMADGLMKAGLAPRDLLRALSHDPVSIDRLERGYNPDQPRVPAGNGRESGQWASGGGGEISQNPLPSRAPVVLDASSSDVRSFLSEDLASTVLRALERAAARLTVAADIFDTIFVPSSSKSPIVEGDVPGFPNLRYRWNQDEGNVAIHIRIGDHWMTLTQGISSPGGIYRDRNGRPIGRVVNNALILKPDAFAGPVADVTSPIKEEARARATVDSHATDDNRPKLCPDPEKESNAGWSGNSIGYQSYVTGLERGLAVRLNGVLFDGCRELNGNMLEAKGQYEQFLSADGIFWAAGVIPGWEAQLESQSIAAALAGRQVEWHIQQRSIVNIIKDLAKPYINITVIYDPWSP